MVTKPYLLPPTILKLNAKYLKVLTNEYFKLCVQI